MKVLWTPRAASDLNLVCDRIAEDNPAAAVRVADRIYKQVLQLAGMPNMGRLGLLPHTREVVFHPWPYICLQNPWR